MRQPVICLKFFVYKLFVDTRKAARHPPGMPCNDRCICFIYRLQQMRLIKREEIMGQCGNVPMEIAIGSEFVKIELSCPRA